MRSLLRGPLDALGVLTRVPVPPGRGAPDLAAAAPWFPVVGALVGVVAGLVGVVAAGVWGPFVAAIVLVLADVLLTGALHLDGLADLADATGGHTRERRLAIMKDHAVGVYGASALVLDLLLRVATLAVVLTLPGAWAVACVASVWALSRAAMLPPALLLPYARPEGTGRSVIEGITPLRCLAGLGVALLLAVVLLGVVPVGQAAAVVGTVLGAALGGLVPAAWAAARLGGATGDVLGAVAECALVGALLGLTATLS